MFSNIAYNFRDMECIQQLLKDGFMNPRARFDISTDNSHIKMNVLKNIKTHYLKCETIYQIKIKYSRIYIYANSSASRKQWYYSELGFFNYLKDMMDSLPHSELVSQFYNLYENLNQYNTKYATEDIRFSTIMHKGYADTLMFNPSISINDYSKLTFRDILSIKDYMELVYLLTFHTESFQDIFREIYDSTHDN